MNLFRGGSPAAMYFSTGWLAGSIGVRSGIRGFWRRGGGGGAFQTGAVRRWWLKIELATGDTIWWAVRDVHTPARLDLHVPRTIIHSFQQVHLSER